MLVMIDEQNPERSWTQVYTDGSTTNAVENGGVGPPPPNGCPEGVHFPTGKHCTNHAADIEALIPVANIISTREEKCLHVVLI